MNGWRGLRGNWKVPPLALLGEPDVYF